MSAYLQTAANIAQVVSVFPSFYCAWVVFKTQNPGPSGDSVAVLGWGWFVAFGAFGALSVVSLVLRIVASRYGSVATPAVHGQWQWLKDMADRELNQGTVLHLRLDDVALGPSDISPYLEFRLTVCNPLVWPVLPSSDIAGDITCAGDPLSGRTELIPQQGVEKLIRHAVCHELNIRKWLTREELNSLQHASKEYSLGNLEWYATVNPDRYMGCGDPHVARINTMTLKRTKTLSSVPPNA